MKENFNFKKCIIRWIIPIVLFISVGFAVYFLLPCESISGDWELVVNPEIIISTEDEVEKTDKSYYSFSDPGEYGDGTYKTYYEGGIEEGKYKLSEKDGKKYINLGTEELEYEYTGSRLLGNAKLTIIYPEYTDEQTGEKKPAQKYIFEQSEAPDYENESYDDYATDKNLFNEWTSSERKLSYLSYEISYTETVNFTENGIMTIHYQSKDLALDRYMYYAYTVENNKLTFSLVTDKNKKSTVPYKIDSKGNLKFIDDKTSSSIFADAIFSDVTYKKK